MGWTRTRAQLGLPVMGSAIPRAARAYLHHEAGPPMPPTATQAQEEQRIRAIHAFHLSLGWQGFGYSASTAPSGRIYEGRGARRSGGHTRGHNTTSLGVVILGNTDRQEPGRSAAGARDALAQLTADGGLTSDFRLAPHSSVGATACPGKRGREEILPAVTDPGTSPPAIRYEPLPGATRYRTVRNATLWRFDQARHSDMAAVTQYPAGHEVTIVGRAVHPTGSVYLMRAPEWNRNGETAVPWRPYGYNAADLEPVDTPAPPAPEPEPEPAPRFSDVPRDHRLHDDVERAAAAGIITGRADGTFGPTEIVSRGQLAAVVSRLLERLE